LTESLARHPSGRIESQRNAGIKLKISNTILPWRRGIVVIASAYIKEDPWFESHQGVRFLGIYPLQSYPALWRRGIVVIVSAYRTEYPRFESRQSVRFLGIHVFIAVLLS
jgi:hypothetical protein